MESTLPVGTSPDVLQHYLTAGIEIEVKTGWGGHLDVMRGKLSTLGHDGAGIEMLTKSGTKTFVGEWAYANCLPVLLPFSALCTPLSDGTVPAKRILEIEKDLVCDPARHLKINDNNLWYHNGNGWRVALSLGDFECLTLSALSAEYLRRNHFAVGLAKSQYIEKPAATPASGRKELSRG